MELGSQGDAQNCYFKGCSSLVAAVRLLVAWPLFSIQKHRQKGVNCLFLYPKLNTTLQIGTSTIHSNVIRIDLNAFTLP